MESLVWNDHLRDLYRPVLEHPDDLAPWGPFADALCELPEVWKNCSMCRGRGKRWGPGDHQYGDREYQDCYKCRGVGRIEQNESARAGGEALQRALLRQGPPKQICSSCEGTGLLNPCVSGTESWKRCNRCSNTWLKEEPTRLPFVWMNEDFFSYRMCCVHEPEERTLPLSLLGGWEAVAWVWKGLIRRLICEARWASIEMEPGLSSLGYVIKYHPVVDVCIIRGRAVTTTYTEEALNAQRALFQIPPYVPGSRYTNLYETKQ